MCDNIQPVALDELEQELLIGESEKHQSSCNGQKPRRIAPRKRLPKPGSYPDDFSPFRMTSGDGMVVSLSYLEIKRDLQTINEQCRDMFQSVYYAEVGCEDMEQSSKGSKPCALSPVRVQSIIAARRSRGPCMKQPTSRAEETRMIMAAVRASLQEIRSRQQEDNISDEEKSAIMRMRASKRPKVEDKFPGNKVASQWMDTCSSIVI
ncbi:hypothetical protein GUITHDRAFT_119134 [Guillardia theta CCMP2712]|uniref:Uncharacterized protein n=2 Tax=Guillardia theta TaxID=55529 RepID=L1IF42_GUITC|nr:hypothetical protein GUITHDRAFT_119134 [Guillardia theta CCMP2712]EKX34702.1 hypothetical protein GUITHDRAFT_119134 [Guillardia theta CCMP2712]|mmetsp:Transcript_21340/g.70726  ORF Transcript_21340/g.70726 Transcript_21340/m.70726 type:complete len:207 (+) Transcript_21340:247-867(+)|eukprot:XP_005821682.1 hypothetical protein GUITHDRAFT_119134 [Guillardia theta CCMP2712]